LFKNVMLIKIYIKKLVLQHNALNPFLEKVGL
jgi:hypothetical protein